MKLYPASLLLSIFAMVLLSACSQADVNSAPPPGAAVGIERYQWTDSARQNWAETAPRPLATTVWYPAADGSKMEEIGIPPTRPVFIGGFAARGAEVPQGSSIYPLILLSHGTGGAAMQMMWLGRALASEGYIVAAIDHHGNTAAEESFDPRGFRMPWERARDMSAVLDILLSDPQWGPRIDRAKIGAAGFSLGGYTITALVGGRADFDRFKAFCDSDLRDATCEEQSESPNAGVEFTAMLASDPALANRMKEATHDYSDDRIRAALTLAPAIAQVFTDESLASIETPYLTLVGTKDNVAPAATNAARLATSITGAELKTIAGANHYAFLNRCNRRGQKYVPVCKNADGISRGALHAEAVSAAKVFFNEALGK